MRKRGLRAVIVATLVGAVGLIGLATPGAGTEAAGGYADPKFEAQWKAGEAILPNFWGPLANAREKGMEAYGGAMRTVQYFDKGRMELTGGNVTNGLLATEIIRGRIQVGDDAFETKAPPAIPIAGDATNPGPTYAALSGPAASLLAPSASKVSDTDRSGITTSVEADGTIGMFTPGGSYTQASLTAFDMPTKHNVARTFVAFREKAELTTIGYAIGEPFWANVLVGGERKAVLVQPFERRILTYTPTNPTGFEVEMGNIGQHYYRWRYESGSQTPAAGQATATGATATTGTATGTPNPNATATPTSTGLAPLPPNLANATTTAVVVGQTATFQAKAGSLTAVPGLVRYDPTPTLDPVFATGIANSMAYAAGTVLPASTAPVTTSSSALTFQNPPASIARGGTATITANTVANAYCEISVSYANGPTRVEGLQDKTADASGKVSWTWRVGPSAATGNAPIEVVCTANGQRSVGMVTTYVSA